MPDRYIPINPPEIVEVTEPFRTVEFWVALGVSRPDLRLIEMILDWMKGRAALALSGLDISYHRATDTEPDMLCGILRVGQPIDIG